MTFFTIVGELTVGAFLLASVATGIGRWRDRHRPDDDVEVFEPLPSRRLPEPRSQDPDGSL